MGKPAAAGVSASGLPPAGDQANGVVAGSLTAVGPGKPFAFWGPMDLSLWAEYNTALTTAGGLAATVAAAGTIAVGTAINSTLVPPGTTVKTIAGTDITLALPTRTLQGNVRSGSKFVTGLASTDWLLGAAVSGDGIPLGATVAAITTPAVQASGFTSAQTGTIELSVAATASPVINAQAPLEFALAGTGIAAGVDADAIFTGAAIVYTANIQIERCFDGGATWLPCNIGGNGQLAQYSVGTPVALTFGEPERQVLYRLNALAYTAVEGITPKYRISTTGGAALSLSVGTVI